MKAISTGTLALLQGQSAWSSCDLFTISLVGPLSGTVLLLTDNPDGNVLSGSTTFTSGVLSLDSTTCTSDLSADEGSITLHDAVSLAAGLGATLGNFVLGLDGASVSIDRALFSGSLLGSPGGFVHEIAGTSSVFEASTTVVTLSVKSSLADLRRPLPKRPIQPSCPYRLFGPGCGLSSGSFVSHLVCDAGCTAQVLYATATATNATTGGWIAFTSGANAGLKRSIVTPGEADDRSAGVAIRLSRPFPIAPSAGDTFDAFRGCDRTRSMCRATFANLDNFGGFPDVAKKNGGK